MNKLRMIRLKHGWYDVLAFGQTHLEATATRRAGLQAAWLVRHIAGGLWWVTADMITGYVLEGQATAVAAGRFEPPSDWPPEVAE